MPWASYASGSFGEILRAENDPTLDTLPVEKQTMLLL